MWDERYNSEEYAYGKNANDFLCENYKAIPKGSVLSLAEGEGRNAVFLAKQGYHVTAVDSSKVGLKKAEKLAKENSVEINLIHADLLDFEIGIDIWDGIISIFCPLPSKVRTIVYQKSVLGLKVGGVFLLEAYTPKQIEYGTGGGNSIDTMTTKESLEEDLTGLRFSKLQELERNVIEGSYHHGLASVVQALAYKV